MAHHRDDEQYEPVDAVKAGIQGALITGVAGFTAAAVKNTLRKRSVGALGVFTHSGGLILTFTTVGGVYEFVTKASANLREKHDHYNAGIGGFLAGSIMGLKYGRILPVLRWGAFTAAALSSFQWCGGTLRGIPREVPGMDEFERRESLRKNWRRPIEETIAEIGEGRGIRGPGYEERRRQRLKETYGVEIKTVSAEAS